eukprot:Rmarinus@m.14725
MYWKRMPEDVADYVGKCVYCKAGKPEAGKQKGLLQPLSIPRGPWESISMDFITGLPESRGKTGILTVVDRFSKTAYFVPINGEETTRDVAEILFRSVVAYRGFPKDIVSDRDPKFTSELWEGLMAKAGTKLRRSTAHHPQTDGQTERMNRTIEEMLRVTLLENAGMEWVDILPHLQLAYNSARQASTGMTPLQAETGHEPGMPLNITLQAGEAEREYTIPEMLQGIEAEDFVVRQQRVQHAVKRNIERAQEAQRRYVNSKRRHEEFKVGDWVMVSAKHVNLRGKGKAKLQEKFYGPCKIIAVISPLAYKIELPATMRYRHDVFPLSLLKRVNKDTGEREDDAGYGSDVQFAPPEHRPRGRRSTGKAEVTSGNNVAGDDEAEVYYNIEAIQARRSRGDKREYLVKWEGYSDEQCTWERADAFEGVEAESMRVEFDRRMDEIERVKEAERERKEAEKRERTKRKRDHWQEQLGTRERRERTVRARQMTTVLPENVTGDTVTVSMPRETLEQLIRAGYLQLPEGTT